MTHLSQNLPLYQSNFDLAMKETSKALGIDIASQFNEYTKNMDFTKVISSLIEAITNIFGNVFLILIYIIFLLIEETVFRQKNDRILPFGRKKDKNTKVAS